MSKDPKTPTRHVRFHLLDKENVLEAAPRTPAAATTKTPHSTPKQTAGSKLLRQHFTQMALTPHTAARRRLLDSGAVRVPAKKQPRKTHMTSPEQQQQQRRIGYDGTPHTPSKELLRSTAASRNQQFYGAQYHHNHHHEEVAGEQQELHEEVGVVVPPPQHRGDFDPVASTLLDSCCCCHGSCPVVDHCQEERHAAPKDVTGDLQDFSGVVRPVAFKLPR